MRCPRCGQGRLFQGLSKVHRACPVCGLDLSGEDSGDGPAAFLIFFVSLPATGVGLLLLLAFDLSLVATAVLMALLIVALTLASLGPAKGLLIALQFFHDARDSGV
jgi:uncharacterized protein (DUF983 family)